MSEPDTEAPSSANQMRIILMGISEQMAPLHEWVTGEVAYFTGQGFTEEQARAMAAAEYVIALGGRSSKD